MTADFSDAGTFEQTLRGEAEQLRQELAATAEMLEGDRGPSIRTKAGEGLLAENAGMSLKRYRGWLVEKARQLWSKQGAERQAELNGLLDRAVAGSEAGEVVGLVGFLEEALRLPAGKAMARIEQVLAEASRLQEGLKRGGGGDPVVRVRGEKAEVVERGDWSLPESLKKQEQLLGTGTDGPMDLRGRVVPGGGPEKPGTTVASAGGGKPAGPTEVGTMRPAGGPAAGPEGPVRTAEPPPERPAPPAPLPEGLAADLLPSLSEDMRAVRAGLSLEDQARFDAKMRRIAGRDPWNPSHEQALRAYLERLKREGTVSEGLRNDSSLEPDKQGALPRPPREPFGDPAAVAELANLRRDAALLLQDIEAKQASFQPKGLGALKKRIDDVFPDDFVKMERGEEAATRNQTEGARGNLKGIQAEWERAQQGHRAGTRVVEVSRKIKVFINGREYIVDIDIIEQGGHRWVEVKFGEPPPEGSPGATNLLKQIDDRLAVSKDPRFYVEGRPPEIAVSFGSGEVSPGLRASLEQRGVKIEIRSQGVLR